jgi:hypothetical protein
LSGRINGLSCTPNIGLPCLRRKEKRIEKATLIQ